MTWLVLGLALWVGAHLFKSLAPEARAALGARLGEGPARGLMAGAIGLGLLLMILGYRSADYVGLWTPPRWTYHLNNLLMLVAVFVFALSHSRGRGRAWLRHPMLIAVMIWAAAHLLVNGDLASLVLFGGLGLWAFADRLAINARTPDWTPKAPGTPAGDARWVGISLVVFALAAAIHTWLGYPPFPQ